ncbi:hypothetical protein [Rhodococcus koreensis]
MTGVDCAYPEMRLSELSTTDGRAAMPASSAACTVDLIAAYAFRSLRDYTVDPRPLGVVRYPGGSHNTTLISGAPGAIDFLAARVAGRAAADDCV